MQTVASFINQAIEPPTSIPSCRREGRGAGWRQSIAGSFKRPRLFPLLVSALMLPGLSGHSVLAQSAGANSQLNSWLNAQANIHTWSADFVQTRTLKSLTQPLTESGHVWFEAPNRFHWELGHPAKTIALRQPNQLMVVYPRLKRVEKFSLDGSQAGPWKDTLALLDAGFPRNRAEIEAHFNVLAQTDSDGVHEVTLQPKSESARRMMPQIKIGFDAGNYSLRSTELQFADGSTMQNVFSNAEINPKIDESLFNPKIDSTFKVVEPFKK